ncbi:MAG: nucleotidyltransferase domain-containing protein [archaeon]|nr:nucleotidyltransferase domain-containing protein [archaeon]
MKHKDNIRELKLKKVEQLELNQGALSVLHWFFAYPEVKITLTELSKELGISKKTASRVVTDLAKKNFLIVEQIGRSWRIHCNIQHPYNRIYKIGQNLSLVYSSGIIEEIYGLIGNPKAIILFGSYRKGDDIGTSDLDIAIEILGNEDLRILNLGTIAQLGFRKNVQVNLHIFSRNKIDLNLFANITNGIVLDGFLEART